MPPTATAPTGEAEVELTDEGARALASALGPRAAALEGRVAGRADSALDVIVTGVRRTTGAEESWPGDRVRVPAAAIRAVRVRRVAVARSVAAAAALAIGAFVVGRAVGGNEASGGRGGRGQQPGQ